MQAEEPVTTETQTLKRKRRVQFQQMPEVRVSTTAMCSIRTWHANNNNSLTTTITRNSGTTAASESNLAEPQNGIDVHHSPQHTELWYSADELDEMRNEVKLQSKLFRSSLNALLNNSSHTHPHANGHLNRRWESSLFYPFENSGVEQKMQILRNPMSLSAVSCTSCSTFRGLEPRIFIEKQRNRYIAFRSVFEFQYRTQELIRCAKMKGYSDADVKKMKEKYSDRLGTMCAEISTWARHEALSSAGYDAKCAYNIFKSTNDDGNTQEAEAKECSCCKMDPGVCQAKIPLSVQHQQDGLESTPAAFDGKTHNSHQHTQVTSASTNSLHDNMNDGAALGPNKKRARIFGPICSTVVGSAAIATAAAATMDGNQVS